MKALLSSLWAYIDFIKSPQVLAAGGILSFLASFFRGMDIMFLYFLALLHAINIASKWYSIYKYREERFDLCVGFEKSIHKAFLYGIVFITSHVMYTVTIKGAHPPILDYFARYALVGIMGFETSSIIKNLKILKFIQTGISFFKKIKEEEGK